MSLHKHLDLHDRWTSTPPPITRTHAFYISMNKNCTSGFQHDFIPLELPSPSFPFPQIMPDSPPIFLQISPHPPRCVCAETPLHTDSAIGPPHVDAHSPLSCKQRDHVPLASFPSLWLSSLALAHALRHIILLLPSYPIQNSTHTE